MSHEGNVAKAPSPETELSVVSEERPVSETITVTRTVNVQRREAWMGWTQVVANLVIVIGLGTTAIAFALQSRAEQRNAASRQIETFYSRDLATAQVTLFQLWADEDLSVFRDFPLPRSSVDTLVEKVISTNEQARSDILSSILVLTSYFDRVQSCVELERCDGTEVDTQLGSYARNFHCTYSGEIAKLSHRLLFASLGIGLRAFSDRMGGCTVQMFTQDQSASQETR
jgi:hypothetical protein